MAGRVGGWVLIKKLTLFQMGAEDTDYTTQVMAVYRHPSALYHNDSL
jgi:hypothetical protein